MRHLYSFCVAFLCVCNAFASDVITSVTASGNMFTITRADSKGPARIYYRTVNGTALAGVHYIEQNGVLEFVNGELSKTVTVAELTPSETDVNRYSGTTNSAFGRIYYLQAWNDAGSSKECARTMPIDSRYVVSKNTYYEDEVSYETSWLRWTTRYKAGENFNYSYSGEGVYARKDTYISLSQLTSQFSSARANYLNATKDYKYKVRLLFKAYPANPEYGVTGYCYVQMFLGQEGDNSLNNSHWNNVWGPTLSNNTLVNVMFQIPASKNIISPNLADYELGQQFIIPVRNALNNQTTDKTSAWSGTTATLNKQKVRVTTGTSDGYVSIDNNTQFIGARNAVMGEYNTSTSSYKDYSAMFHSPTFCLKVSDETPPSIKAVHVNTSNSYQAGNVLRLSVEFDEIVSYASRSYLKAYATINGNKYTLECEDGCYTNVVNFKLTLPAISATSVTSMTLDSIKPTDTYGILKDVCGNSVEGGIYKDINISVPNFKLVNTYTVTLNSNSGTVNGCNVTKYKFGAETPLPLDVTRAGYTFDGWYTTADFSGARQYSIGSTASGNKTYYAKWVPNAYTVALHTNGGNITSGEVTSYSTGTAVTLPTAANFIRTGYTFGGWYAAADFSGAKATAIAATEYGNKEFFAKWTANTVTVTLNGQSATTAGTASVSATYDEVLPTIATLPAKTGHTFGGYYTSPNGLGSQYYTATGAKAKPASDFASATTLYAYWIPNTYTLTLDNQSATVAGSQNVIATYGQALPSITVPSKNGCTFGGYYSSINGAGTQYFSNTGVPQRTWTTAADGTLYAKWTNNSYNITLEANGGTINSGNVATYTYATGATLPTDVTKTGCDFLGWYANSYFEGAAVEEVGTDEFGSKTFYARWSPKTYTVTLNVNGGAINSGNVASYIYGVGATLPTNVTRTGYTFLGWFDDNDVEVKNVGVAATGDKSFIAQWSKDIYTITYNANEGSFSSTPTATYSYGTAVTLAKPTRTGYTFAGWYNNSNLVGTQISSVASTELGNKEFWAKWNVNVYDVALDAAGGEINAGNIATYTYDVLAILPTDVTRPGHSFSGWFDADDNLALRIEKGTTGDVAYTAKWSPRTYSVTLQTNNGTINSGSVSAYTYGVGATLPTDITKEGYDFVGWFDNASYEGGAVASISSTDLGNKNFWAKWTAAQYSVTLNANGGVVNSGNVEAYTYGVGAVLPANVSRTGYAFEGWFSNAECEGDAVSTITTADLGNKAFYAKWTLSDYTITLNANGGTINESIAATYNYGDEIALPTDVTKDGNSFAGWYANSNLTGEIVTTISASDFGEKSYWAKWLPKTYTITLNSVGGAVNSGDVAEYTFGAGALLPTDVTRAGYTFAGWKNTATDVVENMVSASDFGDKTYEAQWQIGGFTVVFNANYGTINEGYFASYQFGDEKPLPTDVTKTGHTFAGWYDNANLDGDAIAEISSEDYGNKAYWAKWTKNTYAVTLNTNGGTINSGNLTDYLFGSQVVLTADVTKAGYTFDGWYDNAECAGEKVTVIADNATGAKTLFAKWVANTYNIILNANNGTINAGAVSTYTYGVGATLPTDVTRTGYEFAGWYAASNFAGEAQTEIAETDLGDKTFYAKWTVNTYAVTLNVNEGVLANMLTEYTYGVGALLPSATRNGYTFAGWYDNAEFGGESINTIAPNETGAKEFYAKWVRNTYSIVYNVNGGSFASTPAASYSYGDAITLAVPTRVGYTFAGWYTNSNMTGEESTEILSSEYGDKEFWAYWEQEEYKVTLNTNKGVINGASVTYYNYGNRVALPTDVTRTGYTFAGWYDNAECAGEPITAIAKNDTGDKEYFAQWIANTYNVFFNNNGGTINAGAISEFTYGEGAALPTDVTKAGHTFAGWYNNSNLEGAAIESIPATATSDQEYWAAWTVNVYVVSVTNDAAMGSVEGAGRYEYNSVATLKAVSNAGYEFVDWSNGLTDSTITIAVTKDSALTANFARKEQVFVAEGAALSIPTLKTEREVEAIDLSALFESEKGSAISFSVASSQPNIVLAQVSDGKLFLTVNEYEGESEITVTATLPNGEKTSVSATATVVLACNIQLSAEIKNVRCYGESNGEIALMVENAAEPYSLLWSDASTNATLSDAAAGNYKVELTDAEGCTASQVFQITEPEVISIEKSIKNPTCSNADGSISLTVTGAENAAFEWSNGETTRNVSGLAKGTYSVQITNTETGCSLSETYTLVEPENPVISVASVVETRCDESAGAVFISTNNDDLLYRWSNGKATKNLTNVPAGDYTLDVVDENNCKASLTVTVPSIALKQPELALVTVSQETGNNLVVWLKENTDLIDHFNIYRETDAAGVYENIAEVPYSELSVFEDVEANPQVQAWRYKITATDVCNTETEMSETHKSLHLQKNQGMSGMINLYWDPYEGIDFSTYVIMRKTVVRGVTSVDTIATLSADNNTYTDMLPARGTTSYYVGIKLPSEINPMTQFLKAESGPFSIALSNIAEAENTDDDETAVETLSKANVEVYAAGHTVYVKADEENTIALYDNQGQLIATASDTANAEFPVRLKGVYFVKVGAETFAVVVR